MKRIAAALGLVVAMAVAAVPSLAASNPNGTGQPSQTCLSSTALSEPGRAASAPGSAFNEPSLTNPAGGIAGQMYAGNGANTNTPANQDVAISQYDVACFQVSQH